MKKVLLALTISLVGLQIQAQNLNSGLEAHFQFENNLTDNSANNYTITANQPVFTTFFNNDLAATFDGTKGFSQSDVFVNTNFTQCAIALWFKAMNTNTIYPDQSLIQGANAGFGIFIMNGTGNIKSFFHGTSVGSIYNSVNVVDSTWHHLVVQNNGTTTKMYVDGNFVNSTPQNLTLSSSNSSKKLNIGRTDRNERFFNGSLNDVRIYNRILTQAEITTLATFPSTTGLTNSDLNSKIDFIAYPNPTAGNIQIETNQNLTNSILSIKNILGQTIETVRLDNNPIQSIKLNGEKGIYFLEIITPSNQRIVKKVIKN